LRFALQVEEMTFVLRDVGALLRPVILERLHEIAIAILPDKPRAAPRPQSTALSVALLAAAHAPPPGVHHEKQESRSSETTMLLGRMAAGMGAGSTDEPVSVRMPSSRPAPAAVGAPTATPVETVSGPLAGHRSGGRATDESFTAPLAHQHRPSPRIGRSAAAAPPLRSPASIARSTISMATTASGERSAGQCRADTVGSAIEDALSGVFGDAGGMAAAIDAGVILPERVRVERHLRLARHVRDTLNCACLRANNRKSIGTAEEFCAHVVPCYSTLSYSTVSVYGPGNVWSELTSFSHLARRLPPRDAAIARIDGNVMTASMQSYK
jgi:hypothetical protein